MFTLRSVNSNNGAAKCSGQFIGVKMRFDPSKLDSSYLAALHGT